MSATIPTFTPLATLMENANRRRDIDILKKLVQENLDNHANVIAHTREGITIMNIDRRFGYIMNDVLLGLEYAGYTADSWSNGAQLAITIKK